MRTLTRCPSPSRAARTVLRPAFVRVLRPTLSRTMRGRLAGYSTLLGDHQSTHPDDPAAADQQGPAGPRRAPAPAGRPGRPAACACPGAPSGPQTVPRLRPPHLERPVEAARVHERLAGDVGARKRSTGSAPTHTSPHTARPGTRQRHRRRRGVRLRGAAPLQRQPSYSLTARQPPPKCPLRRPGHLQQRLDSEHGGARGRRPRAHPPATGAAAGSAAAAPARAAAATLERPPRPARGPGHTARAKTASASRRLGQLRSHLRRDLRRPAAASTAPGIAASQAGSTCSPEGGAGVAGIGVAPVLGEFQAVRPGSTPRSPRGGTRAAAAPRAGRRAAWPRRRPSPRSGPAGRAWSPPGRRRCGPERCGRTAARRPPARRLAARLAGPLLHVTLRLHDRAVRHGETRLPALPQARTTKGFVVVALRAPQSDG